MSGFSDPTNIPAAGRASYGDKVAIQFEAVPKLMPFASREAGYPIYESEDCAVVQQVGSRDITYVPVEAFFRNFDNPEIADTYRDRYSRWCQNRNARQEETGTPLALLFPDEPHIIKTCSSLNVTTIQQLAHLQEEGIRKLGMGARKYVERAQRFVAAAEAGMPSHEVERRLADQASEIASLRALLENATLPDKIDGRTREARALKAHGAV